VTSRREEPGTPGAKSRRAPPGLGADAAVLFVLLVAFYHTNLSTLPVNDATANVALPISLLNEGNLTFTPDEFPGMFEWRLSTDGGPEYAEVRSWGMYLGDRTAAERFSAGELRLVGPRYFLTGTQTGAEYVNYYGLGSGLTALPAFAALHLMLGDLREYETLSLYAGKFMAACAVSGSAVFLFLIASSYTRRFNALLVALSYGLGTCVWSTSSQALWQHGPAELYLAMAIYFFTRAREGPRFAAACGLAAAMAVLCRPTSFVLVWVLGLALLREERRVVLAFIGAGTLIALGLGLYNHIHLGAPWSFAQTTNIEHYALLKTGSPEIWPMSFVDSVPGLLLSPSRGLFVFSPWLVFCFVGMVQAWRQPRYEALRPLALAFAATALIQFSWYDWWGGWSYGYRPLVDTVVYLAVFLIPIFEGLWQRRVMAIVFLVTLGWSVFVQGLGAFAYTISDWNARVVYHFELPGVEGRQAIYDPEQARALLDVEGAKLVREGPCDIDTLDCRYRLWSIQDSQIGFLISRAL
jgi:hypothetical protein